MGNTNPKLTARYRRKKHIRKGMHGTVERPRLVVFRSARHIYAQIVDDERGHTLAAASSLKVDGAGNKDTASAVGKAIAEAAKQANVTKVVFDRNGFKYHGRVAALADAAREAGLEF